MQMTRMRVAAALLLLATMGVLAACDDQGSATDDDHPSAQDSARPVRAPTTAGAATRCTTVGDEEDSAISGGVIAGPFAGMRGAGHESGLAKFWVAASNRQSRTDDAVIRVEVVDAERPSDPALYVRAAKDIKTVVPPPTAGPERIYNGTIFVPTSADTKLRITVTIGEATGCFVTRL
ncbi:hypothetical protein ACWDR2_27445 [Streptomyces sp. NPDC003631]|jgi:hypothetical protein|uniref:Lipoprotein n=1 Tax=Streptomyces lannensis TaxID=766498 RepID=A0ABP7KRR2_9ACTN